ncbi:MAG: sensor histidine kinase [Candidatus Scalindua sp.]
MDKNKTKEQLLSELAKMRHRIAELEAFQTKLRESEEKYHKLLETANDAVFIADAETGIILDANKKAEELLGMPAEKIIGMHQSQLHPQEEAERYRKIFKKHIQNKTAVSEDIFVVNNNSHRIPVEISASVTEIGSKKFIQGIFRDITERKRREGQIKNSEERLKILFECAPEAIYLIDLEGNFQDFNKAAEKLSGYKREEAIGKNLQELKLIEQKQIPRVLFLLAENARGKSTEPEELTLNRKDGKQVEIEIMAYPLRIDNRNLVLGIAHDITERKQVDERLKVSLREKEILLQELYHRTKNNMQVISSLLNLQSATIDDKQTLQIFKETQNRIRSISLVHEKLYQSKDLSNVNLKDYIKDLANTLLMNYQVGIDKISLKIDVGSVFVPIDTAIPWGLIINELMSNSLKYAFPDNRVGEIRVVLRSTDVGGIELRISDNGIGLPRDFNLRSTRSLGLKLVSKLTENELKGEVGLKTENGTEFIIKFK